MGFGVLLVRDHSGYVQAAGCKTQLRFLALSAAEATAALMAIQLCMEMSLTQVCLEEDAKVVIDVVQASGVNYNRLGHVVEDFGFLL
jgi:hypothetical protein